MIRLLANAAVVIALGLTAIPAHAQNNRSFVSGSGSDGNSCIRPAPCRSFAQAITQTNAGGEIIVLDSAGYGAFTINKSITITNPGGVEAAITPPSGGDAITINATTAIEVTLRGLTLSGGGVGNTGITVTPALPQGTSSTLTMIGCIIKGFASHGMLIQPTNSSGEPSIYLSLADSFITNNSGNGIHAVPPTTLDTNLSIYRTVIQRNGNGVVAISGSILVANSHIDANRFSGFLISASAGLTLKASTVTANASFKDIVNASYTALHNENEIGQVSNSGSAFSDGTNNIRSVTGIALQLQSRQ